MKLTKEAMEQYEANLAKAKAEMSLDELEEYERSSRRWNAICDAHENGTIAEILEDIRDYQQGLHDVPGVSRYIGLRGLTVSCEIGRACNRIAIAQLREGHCPDCAQDPCSCFYGYGPVTRWDRFTEAITGITPWIRGKIFFIRWLSNRRRMEFFGW